MNRFILLPILLLMSFCGCRKPPGHRDGIKVQTIDIRQIEKKNLVKEHLDKIRLLPLETNDDCLMGYIKKLEIFGSNIFILDANNNFFVYDTNGSFIFKITAVSTRGPQDINSLFNFYVNKKDNYIGIYDYLKQKFFHYDFQGKLLEVVKSEMQQMEAVHEFCWLPDDQLLLSLKYIPSMAFSNAIVSCSDYKLFRYDFPYPYVWQNTVLDGRRPKQSQNEKMTCTVNMLSDTVYCYQEGVFVPVWAILSELEPAGHKHVDPTMIKDFSDIFMTIAKHKEQSRGISMLHLTDSVAYTCYFYHDDLIDIFWNLNTGKAYMAAPDIQTLNPLVRPDFIATAGNDFIAAFPPHELNPEIIAKECSPEVVGKVSSLREDDNPVLVFYPIAVK